MSVKPALIMAHPGHELRVHHWIETCQPEVCVLTDGSGRTGQSRLESTSRVLQQTGARRGPIYGALSDADIYRLIQVGDREALTRMLDRLTGWLEAGQFTDVAADALEWYNTGHDLCRYLTDAAVLLVERRTGRKVRLWDFLLDGPPTECPEELREQAQWLRLDEAAVQRKLAAAEGYPELAAEVAQVRERYGLAPFTVECLRPVHATASLTAEPATQPFYEVHGERRVASGHYTQVIRFREHLVPLRDALRERAETLA